MSTEAERRRAATNALAWAELAGHSPDEHTTELLAAAVRGDLTPDQLYEQVRQHVQGEHR